MADEMKEGITKVTGVTQRKKKEVRMETCSDYLGRCRNSALFTGMRFFYHSSI